MKSTVSVVIPVYNESRDIAKCLDALMAQTVKPDEIIISNNNSTDNTVEIALKYPRVRVVNEKRKGITYARTTGFNAAKSDIIARVDADTIASRNWVQSIKKHFADDKEACGLAGRVAVRELSPSGMFWFSILPYFSRKLGDMHVGISPLMSGHNMAIRRSVWDKIKQHVHLDDQEVNEDVDLSLFVLRIGKIVYCRDMLVKTRMIELFFNIPKLIRYGRTNKNTMIKHKLLNPKLNFKYEIDDGK